MSTLEEIIDEFAERLRKLTIDAQQRAQRIIERHQSRVEDLDRLPATDQSASAGTNKVDLIQHDYEVGQHEAGFDAEFNAGNETATLPRGLKPFISNLGLGRTSPTGRRRKRSANKSRSRASWNARTRLPAFSEPSDNDENTFADDAESEE